MKNVSIRSIARPLAVLCAVSTAPAFLQSAVAAEPGVATPTHQERELRELNMKLRELIDALVKSGALDEDVVKEFLRNTNEKIVEQYGPVMEEKTPENLEEEPSENVIRVPYIPEFIKDEIRDEVRDEMADIVTNKVVATAKVEGWGVPAALPDWMSRIKFFGDLRVRQQFNRFDDINDDEILDVMAINDGANYLSGTDEVLLDYINDEELMRLRFRFGVKVDLGENFRVNARMATGSRDNPVSSNWTFDADSSSDIYLDQAYFEWFARDEGVKLQGGQMANPHYRNTQLMWDDDFTFPGVAVEYWPLRLGNTNRKSLVFDPFIRAGYFALDNLDLGQGDKYFYSGQVGAHVQLNEMTSWDIAVAYYDFKNVTGVRNTVLDLGETNDTAPDFVQKGNSLFDISFSSTPGEALLALAADFTVIDIATSLRFNLKNDYQITLDLDYVKNIGFDKDDFFARVGADENGFATYLGRPIQHSEETEGYYIGMSFGDRELWIANHWLFSLGYRYLEKDAVLDAYTDSDFHLGGTDGQGYIGKFTYALADHAAFTIKYMSSNEVQGTSRDGLRIDVLQADFEFKF